MFSRIVCSAFSLTLLAMRTCGWYQWLEVKQVSIVVLKTPGKASRRTYALHSSSMKSRVSLSHSVLYHSCHVPSRTRAETCSFQYIYLW